MMAGLVPKEPHCPTDHCFLFSLDTVKVGWGVGGRTVGGLEKQTSSPAPQKPFQYPDTQLQIHSPISGLTAAAAQHTQLSPKGL